MAERRMFAKTIIDSDAFLDMPITSRLLYYDLGMRADDDGFVNSPKKIMRLIGSSMDDMNVLIAKKFVIPFENGVVVIKHWRVNNYIRSDRYVETNYKEQKEALSVDERGIYHVENLAVLPSGIPNVAQRYPQDSIGKDSIGKDNIYIAQKPPDENANEKRFSVFWEAYGKKIGKKNAIKAFSKIKMDDELFQKIMEGVERYHKSRKWLEGYRKDASTWLNGECWNDEYEDDIGGQKTTKRVSAQQYEQRDYASGELDAVSDDLIAEARKARK